MRSEVFKKAWSHKAFTGKSFSECLRYAWATTTRANKTAKKCTVEAVSFDNDFIAGMGF